MMVQLTLSDGMPTARGERRTWMSSPDTQPGFPGYDAMVPDSYKTGANYPVEAGYINYAIGTWDHTLLCEISQVLPFNRWPSGEGFHRSYCFMAADVHQFIPVMWDDHPRSHIASQSTSTRISPIVPSSGSPATSP